VNASRELDLLVAEKVMGQKFDFNPWKGEMPKNNGEAYGIVLPYSTDIFAAWKVVEKMISEGLYLDLRGLTAFTCNFGHPMQLPREATSAPLAICIAALRAKGIEV